jgi:TPP-dependent pyruvate/acetoin dehydrogenase alpha subunit
MPKLNLELYKKLYLVRRSEEKIIERYPEDEMKTPMHMSMGEEAIAVGVYYALNKEDQVFGTYRSHAIYLAKTEKIDDFFAEMYGKDTALLKGKGGSMHMCAPDFGFMGTSAIVASIIPVAVGAAFANKQKRTDRLTVVFLGDGALDEGAFWESLNVACLMKLPIIFVCEDNGLAVHTSTSKRQGYSSITDIVSNFNCNVFKENTTDTEVIYELTLEAIKSIKTTQMPCFMHLRYYRYLEHVGINEDFDIGYRSRKEFEEWYEKDPVKLQREKILKYGVREEEIVRIERAIDNQIKVRKGV